jgi:hypothetical protein
MNNIGEDVELVDSGNASLSDLPKIISERIGPTEQEPFDAVPATGATYGWDEPTIIVNGAELYTTFFLEKWTFIYY